MLKRAIFGVLGSTGRRAVPSAVTECSSDGDTARYGSCISSPKHRGKYRKKTSSESESSNDESVECPQLQSSSSEDENSVQDPKVRRALIRRAAALFASNKRAFLQAMRRHEDEYSDGSSCSEPELVDPSSESEAALSSADEQTCAIKDSSGVKHIKRSNSGEHNTGEHEQPGNFTRGKFHCILCPNKVFIFEADLEKHLQSKVHKKRELEWTRQQQRMETDGTGCTDSQKPECSRTRKSRAKPKSSDLGTSVEIKKRKWRGTTTKRSQRRRDVSTLTPSEIERRKKKFQEKKKRRLLRKQELS